MPSTPDGRLIPPPHADERTMLESWLDFHRGTLALKCAGLDDSQVRLASIEPSEMTLLGLVQHMAEVERSWFQRVLARQDVPKLYEEGKGDGFALTPGSGIEEALATWQGEVERSRELAAERSLDDVGKLPEHDARHFEDDKLSLRWIMLHMIEEYARHNGHADLLRERIDGVTGT